MSTTLAVRRMTTTLAVRRVRRAALGLAPGLLALLLLAAPPAAFQQATLPAQASVFELELPELGVLRAVPEYRRGRPGPALRDVDR